ncbi:MAG: hypothetical protein ACRDTF_22045 [Pseudonocardiaceae bacterium]
MSSTNTTPGTSPELRESWAYWLGTECDEIIMDVLADEFPGSSVVPGALRTS